MTGELHIVRTRALLRILVIPNNVKVPVQLRVLSLLSSQPNRIFSLREIVDQVYGDQADGGVENTYGSIAVAIFALRQKGHAVRNHWARGYSIPARRAAA